MIKVTCEINDYSAPHKSNIRIHNHWNRNTFVELELDGVRRVIDGKEMKRAIDNCMNTGF